MRRLSRWRQKAKHVRGDEDNLVSNAHAAQSAASGKHLRCGDVLQQLARRVLCTCGTVRARPRAPARQCVQIRAVARQKIRMLSNRRAPGAARRMASPLRGRCRALQPFAGAARLLLPSAKAHASHTALPPPFARLSLPVRYTAHYPPPSCPHAMNAFVTSFAPLSARPARPTTSRRTRQLTMTMSTPQQPVASRRNLHKRSVIALRGLSDLGGMTILHELAARILLPTTLTASITADTQLLFGGLVGVWTAALFAERLRFEKLSLIRETEQLPDRWDASIIYTPSFEENEVDDAVAWLYAFEELDGIAAADLLTALASTANPTMRLRLAEALTTYPVPSNVSTSVLTVLQQDDNPLVRRAAHNALQTLQTPLLVASSSEVDANVQQLHVDAQDMYARAVLDRIFEQSTNPYTVPTVDEQALPPPIDHDSTSAWLQQVVAERLESMGKAALSKPDLRQLHASVRRDDLVSQHVVDVDALSPANISVPLFEGLKWSEIHGICTLAMIPAGYELLSLLDGVDLPLRFVGLGWLLAFGGLVAYPQSGDLWRKLKKLIDDRTIS